MGNAQKEDPPFSNRGQLYPFKNINLEQIKKLKSEEIDDVTETKLQDLTEAEFESEKDSVKQAKDL